MKDTIIKGTGNSRSLRSVPNFLTLYPTYEAFGAALVAGELPIDLGGLNPTGVDAHGTDLNKANLLKDTTAALFGLTENAVPDEVLAKINGLINARANVASGSYYGNGAIGTSKGEAPSNPPSLTFPFTPKCVIITTERINGRWVLLVLMNGISETGTIFQDSYASSNNLMNLFRVKTTWSGARVSWYTYGWRNDQNDATASANFSGQKYTYIAIG